MNKENLLRLSDFIRCNVSDEQFDMSEYRRDEDGTCTAFVDEHTCGTVGCALGWSPLAPGLEAISNDFFEVRSTDKDGHTSSEMSLSFCQYERRIFDLDLRESDFLFDGDWFDKDNTRKGFIARVEWLVAGGDLRKLKGWDDGSYYPTKSDAVTIRVENIARKYGNYKV